MRIERRSFYWKNNIWVPGTSEQIEYENAGAETNARNSAWKLPMKLKKPKETCDISSHRIRTQLGVNKKIATHGENSY